MVSPRKSCPAGICPERRDARRDKKAFLSDQWKEIEENNRVGWKIPWMEEPSRLQSMGLLRVRHN